MYLCMYSITYVALCSPQLAPSCVPTDFIMPPFSPPCSQSAGVLVSAVKSSVPVISDQAASLQLNSLAKSTNTVVAELRTAANKVCV